MHHRLRFLEPSMLHSLKVSGQSTPLKFSPEQWTPEHCETKDTRPPEMFRTKDTRPPERLRTKYALSPKNCETKDTRLSEVFKTRDASPPEKFGTKDTRPTESFGTNYASLLDYFGPDETKIGTDLRKRLIESRMNIQLGKRRCKSLKMPTVENKLPLFTITFAVKVAF